MRENGGQGVNRTPDTRIFSPLLYQLSYLAVPERRLLDRSASTVVKAHRREIGMMGPFLTVLCALATLNSRTLPQSLTPRLKRQPPNARHMTVSAIQSPQPSATESVAERYQRIRELSIELIAPLTPEDQVVQTIPEVSPTKWHLAHVTWFFEQFCLAEFISDYQSVDEQYNYLFNSYYYTVGDMHGRPTRGLLSRPSVGEVLEYRRRVDNAMLELITLNGDDPALLERVELGLNHEQQHQELLLTDIKHVFFSNPLSPIYRDLPLPGASAAATATATATATVMVRPTPTAPNSTPLGPS